MTENSVNSSPPPNPRAVEIAKRLHLLHVSNAGIVNLLTSYPFDLIERQLDYLPYRKSRRPEALIIEAVRNNYSPPKEYYAKNPITASLHEPLVPQSAERTDRSLAPDPAGYGAQSHPDSPADNLRLESGGQGHQLALPPADEADGQDN